MKRRIESVEMDPIGPTSKRYKASMDQFFFTEIVVHIISYLPEYLIPLSLVNKVWFDVCQSRMAKLVKQQYGNIFLIIIQCRTKHLKFKQIFWSQMLIF